MTGGRREGGRARLGGRRKALLPEQAVEMRFYSAVDALQRELASAVVRRGGAVLTDPLEAVPKWTLQLLTFALACRQDPGLEWDAASFLELSRRSADYGSRLFSDGSLWAPEESVLRSSAKVVAGYEVGDLLVLLGRASDYGRTVVWEVGDEGRLLKKRDLVDAKSQGVFYTPTFIARHLARRCLPDRTVAGPPTVCDPAVGGGIFLLAAAEVMLERHEPAAVLDSLYGADTDPLAVEVAATALAAACGLWRPGEPPPSMGSRIVHGDSYGGPIERVNEPRQPGAVCWASVFPERFELPKEARGFDVVLTNPPFGRYKVDSDWLMAKEMRLDPESLDALRLAGRQRSLDLRSSGFYSLSMSGVLDKSRIGLERAMQLTKQGGALGAIVPSTINADTQSYGLRENLLRSWRMLEINEFPEAAKLFFEVNQSMSVLAATKGGTSEHVSVRSGVRSEEDLRAPFSADWSIGVLEKLSSKLAIPVRSGDAEDILHVLHRHPRLGNLSSVVNARGEIDVSAFRDSISDDDSMTPLVRGEQVDCFRADLPTDKLTFVDTERVVSKLSASPKLEHVYRPRLVGRQCSYMYRPQRLSFAAVEPTRAVANSLNYLVVEDEALRLYLLAMLNSKVMNWRFKLVSSNNHVANSEIDEFPVPDPAAVPGDLFDSIVSDAETLCEAFDEDVLMSLEEGVFEAFGLGSSQSSRIMGDEDRDASRGRAHAAT